MASRLFFVFVLLVCFRSAAVASPLTMTGPDTSQTSNDFVGRAYIRLSNPTGGATTRYYQTANTLYFPAASGSNPSIGVIMPQSTWSIPAGGYYDIPVTLRVYKNNATAGTFTKADTTYHAVTIRDASYNYTNVNFTLAPSLTTSAGGAWTLAENNILLATVQISAPVPLAKITISSLVTVASVIVKIAGTEVYTGPLAVGANVVLNNATPGNYAAGAVVNVHQGSRVIANGTITKDSSGNFDLTFFASLPNSTGTIVFNMQDDWSGVVSLYIPLVAGGFEIISGIAHSKSVPVTWSAASAAPGITTAAVAENKLCQVADHKTGKMLGGATIHKDEFGSFALSDLTYKPGGENESEIRNDKARFTLDLTNYRHDVTETVVLQLAKPDGSWYNMGNVSLKGHRGGARDEFTMEFNNSDRFMNGTVYRWITPEFEIVASGKTPVLPQEGVEVGAPAGFSVFNSGTLNPREEDVMDEIQYPPETPPADGPGVADNNADGVPDADEPSADTTRKENFDDLAAAVAKGLRAGGPGLERGVIGTEGVDKEINTGAKIAGLGQSFGKILDALGSTTPGAVQTIGKSQSYTLSVAGRDLVLDYGPMMAWIGPIRLLLASVLSFLVAIKAVKIMRDAFV